MAKMRLISSLIFISAILLVESNERKWHEEKLAAQLREKLRLHGPEDNRIDHGPDYKTGRPSVSRKKQALLDHPEQQQFHRNLARLHNRLAFGDAGLQNLEHQHPKVDDEKNKRKSQKKHFHRKKKTDKSRRRKKKNHLKKSLKKKLLQMSKDGNGGKRKIYYGMFGKAGIKYKKFLERNNNNKKDHPKNIP